MTLRCLLSALWADSVSWCLVEGYKTRGQLPCEPMWLGETYAYSPSLVPGYLSVFYTRIY